MVIKNNNPTNIFFKVFNINKNLILHLEVSANSRTVYHTTTTDFFLINPTFNRDLKNSFFSFLMPILSRILHFLKVLVWTLKKYLSEVYWPHVLHWQFVWLVGSSRKAAINELLQ